MYIIKTTLQISDNRHNRRMVSFKTYFATQSPKCERSLFDRNEIISIFVEQSEPRQKSISYTYVYQNQINRYDNNGSDDGSLGVSRRTGTHRQA